MTDNIPAVGKVETYDGVDDGFGEEFEMCLLGPGIFDSLQLVTGFSCRFGGAHEFAEGLEGGVCCADDEGVVAGVDGGGDESGGFGVRTSDGEEVAAHDIGLGTDGNKPVDVFADGDEDFASHVSALLCSRSLVLDMNTSSTLLNEQFCELHDCRETTVTSIGIGDDWTKEVGVCEVLALGGRGGESFMALLAVVEELCHEEMLYLVGDGSVWVVCKIGTGLIG